jgi:hypothetical protein
MSPRYSAFFCLSAGILFIFVARTLPAVHFPVPPMNDLFTAFTLAGSLIVLLGEFVQLKTSDWIIGIEWELIGAICWKSKKTDLCVVWMPTRNQTPVVRQHSRNCGCFNGSS